MRSQCHAAMCGITLFLPLHCTAVQQALVGPSILFPGKVSSLDMSASGWHSVAWPLYPLWQRQQGRVAMRLINTKGRPHEYCVDLNARVNVYT